MKIVELPILSEKYLDAHLSVSRQGFLPDYNYDSMHIENIGKQNINEFNFYQGCKSKFLRHVYKLSDCIMENGIHCLYSLKEGFRIDDKRLDYSYRGYKKYYENAYQKECQKPSDVISGNTLLLGGQWSSEFYHFMFEVLGKINLFCRFLDFQCIDNVVLRGFDKPFINDAICQLVPNRIKIIKGEYLRNVKFQTVFLPSMICDPGFTCRQHVSFLRNSFRKIRGKSNEHGSQLKLFINRRNTRRLISSDGNIKSICDLSGFQIVNMEDLSLLEQIELSQSAKVIAGPHGAGLSNLVFSDAQLIEFVGKHYNNTCYLDLALHSGNKYSYVVLDESNGNLRIDSRFLEYCLT